MTAKRQTLAEQGLTALNINWDAVALLVLFFASFALYARTAAPGVLDGDFGEFQTNIYLLGVSHTGYPLYFILAKLWTLLMPVGDIAYRANVFSGFFGALTLVLLYLTFRTLNFSLLISLGSAALFGVSRVQWSQAVIPDVYTLNSFFIVLVLWLAILWRMGRVPLWYVALAFGFSLTHHRTMIWFAPALGLFALWGGGRAVLQPREFLKTCAALFLPLLLYLYIPLRGESFVGVEYHPQNNVNILALNAFYDLRFGPPGFLWERITQVYFPLMLEQFTPIGFVLGWVGVVALALKRVPRVFPAALPPRQLLLLLGLAHLAESAFAVTFWVVDSEIFFIPSYLTFLFFVAIGVGCAADWVGGMPGRAFPALGDGGTQGREGTLRRGFPTLLAGILLVGMCAYLMLSNFLRVDLSGNDAAQTRWQEILAQPLEQNATIVGPWEDLTPLEYYQYVEGVRPDLKRRKVVIFQDQLKLASQGDIAGEARDLVQKGASIYLTRHPDDTETLADLDILEPVPVATLWRLAPTPGALLRYRDTGKELQAILQTSERLRAGDFVNFLLTWRRDASLDDIRLVLRLLDSTGKLWSEQESLPFGGRSGPTVRERARDRQGMFIPPDAPPGDYDLELATFERDSQNPLPIIGDSNKLITPIKVRASHGPTSPARINIPHALTTSLGDVQFLGYDVSNPELSGGDTVEFSSWWQGLKSGGDTFQIKLQDANELETMLYDGVLLPDTTGDFAPMQIVRARQEITIPPQAAAGYARLLLTLNGQALPAIRISLSESMRRFRTPIVQRPQLTLVGDSLQLLGYKLDRTQFRAGDKIPLTLYWEANEIPPASYKVFVQLLDANGVLRAQRDSIPKNGTLPTYRWFPGEYVTDEYTLDLPPDLAAGDYHIIVGMYDEASGARVPLQDGSGAPLPDNAVTLGDGILIQ